MCIIQDLKQVLELKLKQKWEKMEEVSVFECEIGSIKTGTSVSAKQEMQTPQ